MWARLDARLERDVVRPVALALSGGGDSVALLALAADWARARGRRLLALTVDHGLNPDSADWTRRAGETARALGADWRALRWDRPQGGPGVQARARAARHALIAEAARGAGAKVVLFAHTADDIAEAEWMRAEGSTLGRVREWAPSPAWPAGRGLMLLRPLLDVSRAALRDELVRRGLDWIEDPANADPAYGRSRARAALLTKALPLEGGGLGGGEGAAFTRWAQEAAPPPERDPEPLRAHPHPRPFPPRGGRELSAEFAWAGVLALSRDVAAATLAAGLVCAGGGCVPPRGDRLAALMARLAGDQDFTAALCGARVEAKGASVRLMREAGEYGRRGEPTLALIPDLPAVWDGRFEITAAEAGWRVLPAAGRLAGLNPADRRALQGLPAAARPGLPVLMRDDADGPVLAWRVAKVRALVRERLGLATDETTHEGDLSDAAHGASPPNDLFSAER